MNSGAELDIGHVLYGPGGGTGQPNTIDGGIILIGAVDFDIFNATIFGGVTITGATASPNFCPSFVVALSRAT